MIKEKPIIFNGEMVKAILDGRKTQTRRVIKPQPIREHDYWLYQGEMYLDDEFLRSHLFHNVYGVNGSPYGAIYDVGIADRLWVRETFWIEHDTDMYNDRPIDCGTNLAEDNWAEVWYCADDEKPGPGVEFYSKHPSIHMPRWASRLTLELADIRIERLQDASLEDIKAEGVDPLRWGQSRNDGYAYVQAWKILWNSINAKRGYGYETNPWVWVVEFKRIDSG